VDTDYWHTTGISPDAETEQATLREMGSFELQAISAEIRHAPKSRGIASARAKAEKR